MSNQVVLENLSCNFKKEPRWKFLPKVKQAVNKDDIARLRRLKEIAENNKDNQRALQYKIKEMQASRWHENSNPLVLELSGHDDTNYFRVWLCFRQILSEVYALSPEIFRGSYHRTCNPSGSVNL